MLHSYCTPIFRGSLHLTLHTLKDWGMVPVPYGAGAGTGMIVPAFAHHHLHPTGGCGVCQAGSWLP